MPILKEWDPPKLKWNQMAGTANGKVLREVFKLSAGRKLTGAEKQSGEVSTKEVSKPKVTIS